MSTAHTPPGSRRAPGIVVSGAPTWHWMLVGVVIALFAVLVGVGATTSSIAMPHLTEDGHELPSHLGQVQSIRSDEYNVGTPIQLSMMATGNGPTLSPLTAEASIAHRYPVGPAQTIAFWDAGLLHLGPWLPDAQLFAAHWWLPSLIVLLCMPSWMVLMGGRRGLGWLAGVLVVMAPANFWWSLQPTMVLAYTLLGCTAMLAAAQRFARGQRLVPLLLCVVGGVNIAGLPSNYLIWALLLGGGVLLASSVRLLALGGRAAWTALIVTGAIAAALGLGVVLEGREGLESLTGTLYPGERRASAEAVGVGILFGAPVLAALQGAPPTALNQSELATPFTLSLLVLPLAWAASAHSVVDRSRLGELLLGAWGLGWLVWCMATIGNLGESFPIASSVTPIRAAQSIGIIGVIVLALALGHVRRGQGRLALLGGAGAALVTLYAGSVLRQEALGHMHLSMLWGASIATGFVVGMLLWKPRSWYSSAVAAVAASAVVITASPLQFGLGDLRDGDTARALAEAGTVSREDGTMWASDIPSFDAVMLANGVPAISGLQRSGPDIEEWRRIDRDGAFEEAWNRGGGYSAWRWEEGATTRIDTDGYDFIATTIDPCTLVESMPEISTIASSHPLDSSPCLRSSSTLRWNGGDVHIYTVLR